MRKALLVFCILALAVLPSGLSAQGTLEANVGSNESIVRVYNSKDAVICNNKTQFIYLPNGATAGPSFMMPTDVEVNDFEIIGEEVWFCGTRYDAIYTFGSTGVVGKFNIPGTFGGSADLDYAILPPSIFFGGTLDEFMYPRGMTRIDVFGDAEMGDVAALLCDVYLYQSALYDRVAVMSAYKTGSVWTIHTTIPKDGRKRFTDIACLDDVVVAAGYGISKTHLITKTYNKCSWFPSSPCDLHYFDSIYSVGFNPKSEVRATHVFGNVAAFAQMNEKPATLLHVLEFGPAPQYHAQLYTQSRSTKVVGCDIGTCKWRLDEIRYSRNNHTIHILERGLLPGDATDYTLLWKFPLLYGGEATAEVQKMTGLDQTSMDVDINQNPVTSGRVEARNNLDLHIFAPGGTFVPLLDPLFPGNDPEYDVCTYNTEGEIQKFDTRIGWNGTDDISMYINRPNNQYHPDIFEVVFNKICE